MLGSMHTRCCCGCSGHLCTTIVNNRLLKIQVYLGKPHSWGACLHVHSASWQLPSNNPGESADPVREAKQHFLTTRKAAAYHTVMASQPACRAARAYMGQAGRACAACPCSAA